VLDHALRPLFAYLRAVVVPTGIFAATEDFGSHGLSDRITRAAAELATLVLSQGGYGVGGFAPDLAARPRRTSGTQVEADVTPFGDLLRGHSGTD
jgi:FMN reductase